ncbi:MAG: hypothetical protein DI529_05420 [Chryseobacterium sp.]|nr:MAG: hypothetical protein DI529_05420 [Chryseobacterium sp.]
MSEQQNMTQEEYEANYKRGFEAGYDLSLWEPNLAKLLGEIKTGTPYLEGIRRGNAEFDKEQKYKEALPDFLRSERLETRFNDKETYLEQDKNKGRDLGI